MEFKDKIKNRRAELSLTLEDVAKMVGVSAPTIQRYESGEIKNVRRDKIKLLADALQVTPDYLMDWTNEVKYLEPKPSKDNLTNDENNDYGIKTLAAHISGSIGITKEQAERVIEIAKMFKENK